MNYEKTMWVDHVVDSETGKIIQEGTRFTAQRMNNIEEGIETLEENKVNKLGDKMEGNLELPNLILLGRPLRVSHSILYIDEVNGNDKNDGLTPQSAIKTSNGLNSKMPIFLNANLTIKVIGNFTGVLFINSILTPSINSIARYLTIEGDTLDKNNHTIFGIRISGCTSGVNIKHLQIIGNSLVFENCLGANVNTCTITTNAGSAGALVFVSSKGNIENCEINNSLSSGILATQGSVVNVVNNTGICVNAHVSLGSIIIKSGLRPNGIEIIQSGGAIFNECRGNEPPKETTIASGFNSGWNGIMKYGIDQEGRLQINIKDLVKVSDIGVYDLVYQFPLDFSRYLGSAVSLGFTSTNLAVGNSVISLILETGGKLYASNHGSVTTTVRKFLGTTIIATKF